MGSGKGGGRLALREGRHGPSGSERRRYNALLMTFASCPVSCCRRACRILIVSAPGGCEGPLLVAAVSILGN